MCGKQPSPAFSIHGARRHSTKILWHAAEHFFFFASLTKIGTSLIHSHRTAITVLAAVIFLFDKLREKRSVPLTKQPGSVCFKNPCGTTGASRRDSDIVFLALPPGVSRWKGRTFERGF